MQARRGTHQQDGLFGHAGDALGDAAEKEPPQAAPTVRADDDQVRRPASGLGDDFVCRVLLHGDDLLEHGFRFEAADGHPCGEGPRPGWYDSNGKPLPCDPREMQV